MGSANFDVSSEQNVEEHRNLLLCACETHIEGVTMTAYNYGLTLLQLGQFDLSEKFISKSIQLLHIVSTVSTRGVAASTTEEASNSNSEWHRSIQVHSNYIILFDLFYEQDLYSPPNSMLHSGCLYGGSECEKGVAQQLQQWHGD